MGREAIVGISELLCTKIVFSSSLFMAKDIIEIHTCIQLIAFCLLFVIQFCKCINHVHVLLI